MIQNLCFLLPLPSSDAFIAVFSWNKPPSLPRASHKTAIKTFLLTSYFSFLFFQVRLDGKKGLALFLSITLSVFFFPSRRESENHKSGFRFLSFSPSCELPRWRHLLFPEYQRRKTKSKSQINRQQQSIKSKHGLFVSSTGHTIFWQFYQTLFGETNCWHPNPFFGRALNSIPPSIGFFFGISLSYFFLENVWMEQIIWVQRRRRSISLATTICNVFLPFFLLFPSQHFLPLLLLPPFLCFSRKWSQSFPGR